MLESFSLEYLSISEFGFVKGPTSLCQATTLSNDHALAHKSLQRNSGRLVPPPTSSTSGVHLLDNSSNNDQQDRPLPNNSNHNGRSQTNVRGDKFFQCGKFGRLMYSCLEHQGQDSKPDLSGKGCDEIA